MSGVLVKYAGIYLLARLVNQNKTVEKLRGAYYKFQLRAMGTGTSSQTQAALTLTIPHSGLILIGQMRAPASMTNAYPLYGWQVCETFYGFSIKNVYYT